MTPSGRPATSCPMKMSWRSSSVSAALLCGEAIHLLAAQGILVVHRGKGTFVAAEAQRSGRCDLGSLSAVRSRLRDLFEARLLFEPDLAAMACRRASDEEIAHILSLGAAVEDAIRTGRDRTEYDQAFHQAIVSASHNDFLIRLVPHHQPCGDGSHSAAQHGDGTGGNHLAGSCPFNGIYEGRDAAGAKQAMAIHLHRAINHLHLQAEMELPPFSAC